MHRRGSGVVIPVGMGAEEEGTWEMGVKECCIRLLCMQCAGHCD